MFSLYGWNAKCWEESDENSVPTQSISDQPVEVTITPEGEVHSFLFVPAKTGPYIFYGTGDSSSIEGRVRIVDSETGGVQCFYEPDISYQDRLQLFTVRFEAVRGKRYYLDTTLQFTEEEDVTYKIAVKADDYTSVVYKPRNRVELLYDQDGEMIEYGDGKQQFQYDIGSRLEAAAGRFEFIKTDGTKKIYQSDGSGFYCDDDGESIYAKHIAWYSDQSRENPWGIGRHLFTMYIEGKQVDIPVWVVSAYSEFEDDDGSDTDPGKEQNESDGIFCKLSFDGSGGTQLYLHIQEQNDILSLQLNFRAG